MLKINNHDIKRIINLLKIPFRVVRGVEKNQTLLLEFLEKRPESEIHRETKRKIARELKEKGKKVFLEKTLYLNSIRIKPDICYLEHNKWNIVEIEWNIVEIEFGNDCQNKIFKNYDVISKVANIKVIDL